MTDIMHHRPRFDFSHSYFRKTYKDECISLRLHLQLVRDILNRHIESQREYVQRIWRDGQKGSINEFGLPPNIICKQLISINNSCPALKNIYLLEFHPSLCLASLIPTALQYLFREFRHIYRPHTAHGITILEKKVLQLALDTWQSVRKPESLYSAQLQKDLFSDAVMGDPFLVVEIGMLVLKSAAGEGKKQSKDSQAFLLETFSRLLELSTLRYRLIEMSVESAHLAWLYKIFTQEMGFDEFHLYLRPVYFEFASHKEKADQPPPVFLTALLEDNSRVDRYAPSTLQLAISEVDDNHIGKFSFHKKESIFQLLFHSGVENMQVTLACQTAQKNALMVTVQQAAFCHSPQSICPMDRQEGSSHLRSRDGADSTHGSASIRNDRESASLATAPKVSGSLIHPSPGAQPTKRTPEAFVSIQLEKLGPRDMMLNTFLQRKEIVGEQVTKADEIGKVKREVIVEYCQKLNHRMSQYSLRGQIIAYCNSLRALLEDFPTIRNTFFMIGQPQERKREKESKERVQANPRNFQPRPRCLLSSDGRTFLNLWFITHHLEVLIMFKTLPEKDAVRALKLTLRIIAPLHDIVAYLFSFAKLGSGKERFDFPLSPKPLKADWGGIEGIGAELRDVQRMIDSLQNPQDPNQVAQSLMIRREVMFLQFDAAVRHLIRGTFLLAGNVSAYQTVTDSLFHGLQPMSNNLVKSVFASQFCLPQPLDPQSHQAFVLFPWRAFLAVGGPFPVILSSPDPLEYNMQLCLCGLNDQDRKVAHGELVSVQLQMEDVLLSSYDRMREDPRGLRTSGEKNKQSKVNKMTELNGSQSWGSARTFRIREKQRDPLTAYAFLRSFLIIWKQLEMLKEGWGQLKLRVADINTVALYQQFLELYGANILYPAMKTIARQMGKEDEFEGLMISCRSILPPKGASEVEIKTRQLQKLLENFESHMIHEVLRKVNKEITLVMSEKAKEDRVLPTELWKHQVIKENVSIVRPQIVEIFIQRLMESYQDGELEITFKKDHLETCLLSLGCDVMARERSNFETYSIFYENLLQQANQMLYQKEQEINAVRTTQSPPEENVHQVAELVQDMILEITALRARLMDLEDESLSIKEKIRKEVQEEYEALVRALFATCLHIKEKLDEHQLKMSRKVCDLISEVRKEGVDSMIDLKKKIGFSKVANGLKENLAKEQIQVLQEKNRRLEELVCKVKTISHWKLTVQQQQLQRQLRNAEKEATQSKKNYLRIKIMAEHKTILLQQQLLALRKALAKSQAENLKMEKQLDEQKQLLKEFEYKMTHETLNRQQLDVMKTSSMEKLLEDIEKKDQRLYLLTEEAERSSKMGQLQQKKIKKEIQQIKSQLAQERSLKLDAFQRVDKLQSQLYDIESASIQINSLGGLTSWANYTRSSVSTPCRYSQQYLLKSDPKSSEIKRIQRPRTVPTKCRRGESCLPNVTDNVQPAAFRIPTVLQPTSLLRPTQLLFSSFSKRN
uniref:Coiled-coil domain containing 162 n=2 Tax=Vombatus ursinus TaxID=29139 RepID=A0A4X2KWR7_VOMUR